MKYIHRIKSRRHGDAVPYCREWLLGLNYRRMWEKRPEYKKIKDIFMISLHCIGTNVNLSTSYLRIRNNYQPTIYYREIAIKGYCRLTWDSLCCMFWFCLAARRSALRQESSTGTQFQLYKKEWRIEECS